MKNKVVITGLGMLSSYGTSIEDFKKSSSDENINVQLKKDWDMEDLGTQYFFQIPDFEIKDHFDKLKAPYPLRYSQLAMLGCLDALKDAQLLDAYNDVRTGLIIDTSLGASEAVEEYLTKLFKDGPRKVRPFKFSQTVSNVCLGYAAREFKLRGPSSLLFGESSLSYGYDLIQNGEADIMICGGVDSIRDYVFGLYNSENHLLNCKEKEGLSLQEQYRTDIEENINENVIAIGEAAAFVVLESEAHAQKRKANIYAELVDYYSLQDQAYEKFIFQRNTEDYTLGMQNVLKRSKIASKSIDLIVGEAYSPLFFEQVEKEAIETLWQTEEVLYTTVKPYIGETFSASAQASVALAACLLKDQKFKKNPMSAYYNTPSNVYTEPKNSHKLKTAIVNTGQLGGNNTSFILKAVNP